MLIVAYLVCGLALLVGGAELLVRGAVRIAKLAGVSPLVIGLTVVAFGTSAPEMAVCTKASIAGNTGIALGDVVGANVLNPLLVLGLSSLFGSLLVARQLVRLDLLVMIGASLGLWLMAAGCVIRPWHGALLLLAVTAYTVLIIRKSRREMLTLVDKEEVGEVESLGGVRRGLLWNLLYIGFVLLGLGMLVGGSDLLVKGAIELAMMFGVNEVVIGLTVVALGTTSPEMTTTIVASLRGHRDIAVGNIIGSNIFNIMAVLGMAAVVSGNGIAIPQTTLAFDIPLMVGVAVICLPVFLSGMVISRVEGAFFVLCYIGYTLYRVATARNPGSEINIGSVVAYVVIPVAAVWTGLLLARRRNASSRTNRLD
jgi:cation:H+ antiporter